MDATSTAVRSMALVLYSCGLAVLWQKQILARIFVTPFTHVIAHTVPLMCLPMSDITAAVVL